MAVVRNYLGKCVRPRAAAGELIWPSTWTPRVNDLPRTVGAAPIPTGQQISRRGSIDAVKRALAKHNLIIQLRKPIKLQRRLRNKQIRAEIIRNSSDLWTT